MCVINTDNLIAFMAYILWITDINVRYEHSIFAIVHKYTEIKYF